MNMLVKILTTTCLVLFLIITVKWYNSPTPVQSTQIYHDSPYVWNEPEKSDMIKNITEYFVKLNVPSETAEKISSCMLDKFMVNRYNYPQLAESIRRLNQGGQMSNEMWTITLECVNKEFRGIYSGYKGWRNPKNLLVKLE